MVSGVQNVRMVVGVRNVARQMGTHSCIMRPGIVGHCVTAEADLRAMRQPMLSPEAN